MPHASKLKYTQLFNSHDRNKRGSLTGRDEILYEKVRNIS